MFDKFKQNSSPTNTSTPTINEPSSQPSSRHQSSGSGDERQANRLSVSGERGRSTSTSNAGARNGSVSRSRSRKRDVFWKSALFDSSNQGPSPKDGNVRAKSLSVNKVHPTVMEEHMKATDWSRRRA